MKNQKYVIFIILLIIVIIILTTIIKNKADKNISQNNIVTSENIQSYNPQMNYIDLHEQPLEKIYMESSESNHN